MPYDTLRNPGLATPPQGQASSIGTSTNRDTRRTPGVAHKSSRMSRQVGTIRLSNAPTPYRRVANEVIEHRRTAALTPGRDRRRSGRQQRESPRDIVNPLSRALAPRSKTVEALHQSDVVPDSKIFLNGQGDDRDDMQEPPPKFSVPLGDDDDDDDSLVLPPPQSAELMEDDDLTQRSVEQARKAIGDQLIGNIRGSFGSTRTSAGFGDLNDLGLEALPIEGPDSSFVGQDDYLDYEEIDVSNISREYSHVARQSNSSNDATRISMALGRTSDIRLQEAPEDDEATFILPLPGKDPLLNLLSPKEQTMEGYDEQGQVNGLQGANINSPEIDVDEDVEMHSPTLTHARKLGEKIKGHKRNGIKVSRYGIRYHILPVGVVKKLTMMVLKDTNNKSRLSKDTLDAIMQASDWFFEQASDDLGAYAEHAGRKTIDESDTITLMKRQHQTKAGITPFALAQKYLPRELLQEIRMAPPSGMRRRHLE